MSRLRQHHRRVLGGILGFLGFLILWLLIPRPSLDIDSSGELLTQSVVYNSAFRLHFSQPMARTSVEKSFSIYPAIQGSFSWPNSRTLEFFPKTPLELGDEYRVRLKLGARSIFMKSMDSGLELLYRVTGSPYVAFVFPEEHEDEPGFIDEHDAITILFDRSMDLEKIQSEAIPILNVSPATSGSIEWIGDRAFKFLPGAWPMGSTLEFEVPAGIPARDGGLTEVIYPFKLQTPAPEVVSTHPVQDDFFVKADAEIRITFNQDIPLSAVKPGINVLLFPSNDLDANDNPRADGFFNTTVTYGALSDGSLDRRTLVFKPSFPYQFDQEYRLVIKAGLPSLSEQKSLSEDFELIFKTSAEPSTPTIEFTQGILAIRFSTPVTDQAIRSHVRLKPDAGPLRHLELDEDGLTARLFYDLKPSQSYEFYLEGEMKDAFGNPVPTFPAYIFTSDPLASDIQVRGSENTGFYRLGDAVAFDLAVVNTPDFIAELCALSEAQFVRWTINPNVRFGPCSQSESITLEMDTKPDETLLFTLDTADHFEMDLRSGAYLLRLKADNIEKDIPFIIGDFLLFAAKDADGLLVWAADFKTGKPVADATLTIYGLGGQVIAKEATNANGIYQKKNGFSDAVLVMAQRGSEITYSALGWDKSWEPASFGLSGVLKGAKDRQLLVFLDNHIARPGDVLKYRGWQHNPVLDSLRVELADSFGSAIIQESVPIYRDASLSGELRLPSDLSPGYYHFRMVGGGGETVLYSQSVWIQKNPPFTSASSLTRGELVHFKDPSASLKGALRAAWYDPALYLNEPFYSFGPVGFYHCRFIECEALKSTSEKPVMLTHGFDFTSALGGDRKKVPAPQKITFQADASDTPVLVWDFLPSDFYIGLTTRERFLKGDRVSFDVIAVSPQGQRLDGKTIKLELLELPSQSIDFLSSSDWFDLKGRVVGTASVVSSSQPTPVEFQLPKTGTVFMVRAMSTDAKGNEVRSEVDFYRESGLSDLSYEHPSLNLAPEFPAYYVGGKARLLITSPYQAGGQVLLVIQQENIIDYRLLSLESPIGFIEIPLRSEMLPNVHVSAILIPPNTSESSTRVLAAWSTINLVPLDFSITVDVQAQSLSDGGHLLKIRTRDYQNRPIPSVLSLWGGPKGSLSHLYSPLLVFYENRMTQVGSFMNVTPRFYPAAPAETVSGAVGIKPIMQTLTREESFSFHIPVLPTDQGGYGEQIIQLPPGFGVADIGVIASGDDGQYGYGFTQIAEKESLVIKPSAPTFARAGDEFNVTVVAQNFAETPREIELKMRNEWFDIQGGDVRKLVLGPGESKLTVFPVGIRPISENIQSHIVIEAGSAKVRLPILLGPDRGLAQSFDQEIQRLYSLLPESDPVLTALMVHYFSPEDSQEIIPSLVRFASDVGLPFFQRLSALWGLGLLDQYDTAFSLKFFESRDSMTLSEKGLLLSVLTSLFDAGQKSIDPYVQRLQSEITSESVADGDLVYFESESNLLTQAILLDAFLKSDKENVLIPGMERALNQMLEKRPMMNYLEAFWVQEALDETFSYAGISKSPSATLPKPGSVFSVITFESLTGESSSVFKVGDVLRLKVMIVAPDALQNTVLKLPIPAGLSFKEATPSSWDVRTDYQKEGFIYAARTDVPRGVYELEFLMEAKYLGDFIAPSPEVTHAGEPDWVGDSRFLRIEVKN